MPITLTFKALNAGVGPGHALGWAFTFGIFYQNETAGVSFELRLSKIGSSALGLITLTSLIIRFSRST